MKRKRHARKLLKAVGLILVCIVFGISGFMGFENYNLREAFYMTIITISTVGFKEVRDLSPNGQMFTALFIIFNLFTFAYIISVISAYLFEGELQKIFKVYMSTQDLKKVENHVIVCGYGRNGSKASQELIFANERVVVIETEEKLLKENTAANKYLNVIVGDATQDETLLQAGIKRAKAIITTLPKDADNVFVTLTAREFNPHIRIIARASDKSTESKLIRAGANSVVMPEEIGGIHMANLVIRPDVIQFLDMIDGLGRHNLRLEELKVQDLRPELKGKTLQELQIRPNSGATVMGLKTREQDFIVSPPLSKQLYEGDVLLVLGTPEQIESFIQQYRA